MKIEFLAEEQIFHLSNERISYALQLLDGHFPSHLYWGRKIRSGSLGLIPQYRGRPSFSPVPFADKQLLSFDAVPFEYPGYGSGDFRHPAYQVELPNGSTVTETEYQSHRIIQGKPELQGLPATYAESDAEAQTLEIELKDRLTGLVIVLSYTVFAQHDAIARSVRFRNDGADRLKLLRALSVSIDFHGSDYELLHLSGAWARERMIERRPLVPGMQGVESRRGSSSHNHNPFIALLSQGADEDHGEVYGFSLVYSGNFVAQAEVDHYASTRVTMGINPFDFSWLLEPGQSFQTPEAVMVYSAAGLGEMSRTYHKLYQSRLVRGTFRDQERPVLVNNWEATYFNFTADKIESIAKVGKELGIEMFVLDDGWFGKRDSDNCSLGDWFVDRNKLPNGLEDLVERVRKLDMRFGLWFEPEMVSPDSDLYRNHPDWCLHVPDRRRTEGRQQLILDLSREDVCDAIYTMVSDILKSAPITYVKWDMNRNMTEIGSALLPPEQQRETVHRYYLGLYRILEQITTEFPDILFESCSGGG
ncbi:MAG: alpha-galactosidase, partial [Gorillibacterium sp.]|nr:alpha-galactosidase [Gorillibacterium sp.]